MHRIRIDNFGPLKQVDLEVPDFLTIIGPQASGKSTICRVIYFFRSLRDDLHEAALNVVSAGKPIKIESYSKIIKNKFLDFWGSTFQMEPFDLNFEYQEGISLNIGLEPTKKLLKVVFSAEFIKGFKEIIKRAQNFNSSARVSERVNLHHNYLAVQKFDENLFFDEMANRIDTLFDLDYSILFIPAGRSLVSTLSEQMDRVDFSRIDYLKLNANRERAQHDRKLNPHRMDYMMRAFISHINRIKPIFSQSMAQLAFDFEIQDDAIIEQARTLIQTILKGEYSYSRQGEKILINDQQSVHIKFASSGQQESVWPLMIIFAYLFQKASVFLVFEEPEAHLHPQAQSDMIALIALMLHAGNRICLTTHSPYILASINNLLLAHKVGQKKKAQVSKLVRPEQWIPLAKIAAFFLEQGRLDSIVNEDLQMLEAERIDQISSVINHTFDSLSDLDD